MLKIHLSDGRTLSFDLSDPDKAKEWLSLVRKLGFQDSIRGMTVQHNGGSYSLTRPDSFHHLWLFAEHLEPEQSKKFKGGKRLICQADDVRVSMMIHEASRAVRVSLSKTGTQRYNPIMDNGRSYGG